MKNINCNLSWLFITCLLLVISNACSTHADTVEIADSTSLPPVETRPKVASQQTPAFSEQTRAPGVRTSTAYVVQILTRGLSRPSGLSFLPDGRMVVSERGGTIRIVSTDGVVSAPLQHVPAVRARGDGGLLDVKVSPDFYTSRLLYWCYVEGDVTGVNAVARARLSVEATSLEDVQVVYRGTSPYAGINHNGSRMLFDAQGNLYVSFGERFDTPIRAEAQLLSSSLGKIIRIKPDGQRAEGNPFISDMNARPEVFAIGLRNPQGLAFHPQTGELWCRDHGPQAGDEINRILPGLNYGWPVISYGLEYDGSIVGNGTQQNGMEQPVYYWDPAIAPSGITFYTGSQIPEWKDNLFVATLRGAHIVRLVIDNNRVIGEERLLQNENQRFRLVVQGPDGALYAITDEAEGRLYRIGV